MADLKTLLSDKDFMKGIVEMETPEQVQKAFKDKGVEISTEQVQEIGKIINATVEKGSALSEDELEGVSGGSDFVDGLKAPFKAVGNAKGAGGKAGAVMPLVGIGAIGVAVGTGVTFGVTKLVKWAKKKSKEGINL